LPQISLVGSSTRSSRKRASRNGRIRRAVAPPGLAAMPPDLLPLIAEHAEQDPSTETNPRPVTRADYEQMLRASLDGRTSY
jgi:hypothetical protein